MNYKKINQALVKEFGAGQVEVHKASKDAQWEYTLWFLSDAPAPSAIERAKEIVGYFEWSRWFDELSFHSAEDTENADMPVQGKKAVNETTTNPQNRT
ncbi:MAG: hypothetical protein WC714_28845 [Candidatus Obscuribacterales bacterium]|jgi:hypothetical protein